MLNFCFLTPKGTSLRGTASFDVFCTKIGSGAWAVGRWKNLEKRKPVNIFDVQFRAYVEKKPLDGLRLNFACW